MAKYLEVDAEDLEESDYNNNGFDYGGEEYLILTDEEADERAEEDIDQTVWAFNADFIISHSKLPYDAKEMIQSYQEDRCEEAGETIKALIEDWDRFVSDAISSDGRGHFISGYDGEENEVTVKVRDEEGTEGLDYLYIYRLN